MAGGALSSLSPGSYAVDEGVTLRGELARSMPIGASSDIAVLPYVFAAVGGGRLHNPTAVAAGSLRAANLGVELRLRLWRGLRDKQSLGLGLEYGKARIDTVETRQDSRLNLNLNGNF